MKRIYFLILFIFLFINSQAQLDKNEFDKEFALRVKQIDEFIERFNFDTLGQNLLKEYIGNKQLTNKDTFNRAFFIKSLINQEAKIDFVSASEFISFVDNSKHPFLLDFYDNDWYAFLSCDFYFLGKPQKVQLILKNQVKEEKISKWVIYSVKSELFNQSLMYDSTKIMNPMSHAVDFMSIDKAFEDKKNSANYFRKDFQPDALNEFYFSIQKNLLTFKKINSINYYFLQIPNWFLKIEYFNRQSNNSGWLISQLRKMNLEEKIQFKNEMLNIK